MLNKKETIKLFYQKVQFFQQNFLNVDYYYGWIVTNCGSSDIFVVARFNILISAKILVSISNPIKSGLIGLSKFKSETQ